MKKMLVIFLILFSKVLADSDEDKYVDLLPDSEKQQFLENVARRIMKDVEGKDNVTGAQSGEVSDDQLKQHTEYVKSVIKEEQGSNKNKGDVNDESSDTASEEKEVLGVQPLDVEKTSLQNERESKESTSAPIIKRSIEDDGDSKSVKSDETSETTQELSQNVTSEETSKIEAENEKFVVDNIASHAKVSPEKNSKAIESTTAGNEVDKAVSVQSNQIDDARNVSVKAIHESRRTNKEDVKSAENTTDIDTTTSTVEVTGNKAVEYNNVSSTEEKFTTLNYPFESSSLKGNTTESTTLDGILFESTTELTTKKEDDYNLQLKPKKHNSKDSENEVVTNTTISTRTSTNEQNTESVTGTTEHVTETTKPVTQTTEPVTETTKPVTQNTEPVTETTKPVTETMKPVTETTTDYVIETTELVPETTTKPKIVTTEAPTESTDVIFTTESIPVATIEKMNIIVEDFTSAPTPATTLKSKIFIPKKTTDKKKMVLKKRIVSAEKVTAAAKESNEESKETTTKKIIKHKVIVHKPEKIIVGPLAKKRAAAKKNEKLYVLEKIYFNKNFKAHVGKEYHVYEVPAGQSPFIGKEAPVATGPTPIIKEQAPVADQPYYVPVYNYAPNNAYFNPQNRLGPNAEDSSSENNAIFNDDDDENNLDRTETLNVKMGYDRTFDNKRKKFGSKKKTQSIYRLPTQNDETEKSRGKVNPEDYLDSDYYFGRVRKTISRKADLSTFPNSDEADHPAHSIREGSLKDHVRAVRNILFQQKSFGLLDRDKYGASVEQALRKGRQRNVEKKSLRKDEDKYFKHKNNKQKKKMDNGNENQDKIANAKYFGTEKLINKHIQKVGYLKKDNNTKELYVIDDIFKANVQKFIEEQDKATAATPNPFIEDTNGEVTAFLRKDESMHRAGKSLNNNNMVKRDLTDYKETMNAELDQDYIPVNLNEENVTENLKLSLTKNQVVKVDTYLQVLKDMVALDNKALVQFDWLGTTVDIQAALQKLFELTALVANEEDVHPSDMEILKYILFMHKLSSEILEANDFGALLRKKLALPRNKKKKLKPRLLKEKGLINRVWLYLREKVPEVNESKALKQLNSFFIGVEDGLYDLHDAIKHVAKITQYKNQHWYQNLKDLYISTDEKHLLEILLHMTALRLFTLIEDSAKNGLEDDYIKYMKKNRQHSKRTLEEMMFVMQILNEYTKYVK